MGRSSKLNRHATQAEQHPLATPCSCSHLQQALHKGLTTQVSQLREVRAGWPSSKLGQWPFHMSLHQREYLTCVCVACEKVTYRASLSLM